MQRPHPTPVRTCPEPYLCVSAPACQEGLSDHSSDRARPRAGVSFPFCLVFCKAENQVCGPLVAKVHGSFHSFSTLSALSFFFLDQGGMYIHTYAYGERQSLAHVEVWCLDGLQKAEMLFKWDQKCLARWGREGSGTFP